MRGNLKKIVKQQIQILNNGCSLLNSALNANHEVVYFLVKRRRCFKPLFYHVWRIGPKLP